MTLEINTDDFWKELDQRVIDARTERKLFIEEITELRAKVAELETALREAKEALEICLAEIKAWRDDYEYDDFNSPFVNSAIATINKVLGDE